MTRDELIERVARAMQNARDEIGATEQQRIAFAYAEAAMRSELQTTLPDIPIEEREEGWRTIESADAQDGNVLVCHGSKVTVAHLWRGSNWIDVLDDCRVIEPTHWQPLPSPPSAPKDGQ